MDSIQNTIVSPGAYGSMESLAEQAKAGDARSIARVAADFESLFASMVLKEMRQTLQPDTLFGSDSSDAYGGLFDFYLGQHIVQAGGFGIANMVRHYLEQRKENTIESTGGAVSNSVQASTTNE
jgi:Rod binding domain-containing protein